MANKASTEAEVNDHNVPAVFGGDLPPSEQLAVQEDHVADGADSSPKDPRQSKDLDDDMEKYHARSLSSSNSVHVVTGDPDLEKNAVEVTQTESEPAQDPNIVDWDGPDDPANPMNWTHRKQWANIAVLSLLTFITPLASSMFAPSVPQVLKEFNVNNDLLATWVVSVYILGFAAGPLIIAPLSEMYGRMIIYNVCNVIFLLFTIACALSQNITQLIVFRFFAGAFGIAPITNGGGSIADMMATERRGAAMSIWALGPLIGPVIGPAAGGFLSEASGWRWIFWLLSILTGVAAILCLLIVRESYPPTLLERKAERLRKETGNMQLRSKLDNQTTVAQLWKRSLLRPLKLMTMSLICALLSLQMACVYGVLYLLFTTFTFVFEGQYGFSESIAGLVYIGLGVGMLFGLLIVGIVSDKLVKHLAQKHSNGQLKPEYRLPLMIYGGPTIPMGLFIYGWSAQYKVQWFVPIFGTSLIGIGLLTAFMSVQTYLVDAFTLYAASALAANTILRSILGAIFPLFALDMYNSLGLGWGNSLLAFITLALCAVPVLFYKYGERIRTNPRFQVKL